MDAIDCDVHCAPASYDALAPYLSDYWRQYIAEAGIRLTGLAHAYPRGGATVPDGYEALASDLLGGEAGSAQRLVVLNCLTGFETHRNPYFSAAVASAINDWTAAEMLDRDDRLRASLVVSSVSTEDAVAEISRVGEDPRFVQVLLPVRSDLPWGHKNNHPIFAAAREHSLQVGLHAWGRAGKAPTPSGFTTTYLEDYVGNQPIAQAQVLSFVSEGVVAEHFVATTAPAHLPSDPVALEQLLEMTDAPAMLAYASDYPHDHGNGVGLLLDRLSDDERERVMWRNASALYGLGD